MKINVIFDTICPWCFIGKRRLDQALAKRPVPKLEFTWQAFLLNPDMPVEGLDHSTYLAAKFGGDARSQRVYSAIADAGRNSGIEFNFDAISRTPNSIDSHRLVRYADRTGYASQAVELLFQAYFLEGSDIGNRSVLVKIAEQLGFKAEAFREYLYGSSDLEDINQQNARAHRIGVSGVPAFIIDGQFSVSGAQEPMILQRVLDVAREKRLELSETGTQPL